jgi:4-amino-4-deoxy-L-arabinose transferase-like glycosyltransferase
MRERLRDYAILLSVSALLTLPFLGTPSLWDLDEGVNAQTAREMRDANTWVIPTFNFQLRTAKPVMLYWLERFSYSAFGLSEWSARLPSALAGFLSVLLIYELGRRMFGRATGLLAGLILPSVAQFAMLTHAATPDSTLLACNLLAFLLFWSGHLNGSRTWWRTMAIGSALGFLTKGPIGVVLPGIVVAWYFAWNGELRRLFSVRFFLSAFIFALIAGPWYGIVSSETRGEWLKAFIAKENVDRFLNPMDRHEGFPGYYLAVMTVMYSPWSAFLIPLFWYGYKGAKHPGNAFWQRLVSWRKKAVPSGENGETETAGASLRPVASEELPITVRANRFLLCWIFTYLLFFSVAATRLPNYILPIYPAMAILTARFLIGWRDGTFSVPAWLPKAVVGGMTSVGVITVALLVAADVFFFPGMGVWAVLGLIPIAGAIGMGRSLGRADRSAFIRWATVCSIAFMGLMVIFPVWSVEGSKAPKELVRMSGVANPKRDIRLGNFEWMLPSVVFYSGREVKALPSPEKAAEFLAVPTPGYLFVTEAQWNESIAAKVKVPCRIVARHYDFLEHGPARTVLVVTNEMTGEIAAAKE